MDEAKEVYAEHAGSVRVSGMSKPVVIAHTIQRLIESSAPVIEIFYIGANAGHQATKAMTIVAFQVRNESSGKVNVMYEPRRVSTLTLGPNDGRQQYKDASVWKLTLVQQV